MYEYYCELDRVIDGDTIDVYLDLGFNIKLKERFRLANINAPGVSGAEKQLGKEATIHLGELIKSANDDGGRLVVVSEKLLKKGKYGRYIATIYLDYGKPSTRLNLNQQMIEDGYAVPREY